MNPLTFIFRTLCLPGILLLSGNILRAATISEPPAVIYGKVIQLGDGASYQLFRGTMVLTIVNQDDSSQSITRQVSLRETGPAGEFSYRLELPQRYLPVPSELEDNLIVDFGVTSYRFESIMIDGETAEPLDSAHSVFETSFSGRAGQHQLDLKVSLSELDSDSDGVPDWWEDLYGLNRFLGTDASMDSDGDTLSNLEEYRGGTNPLVANTDPLLRTRAVLIPVGGDAGLHLSIIDMDSTPAQIQLNFPSSVTGLSFTRSGYPLAAGSTFSQADVIGGLIGVQAAASFTEATLPLEITDQVGDLVQTTDITVKGFSPILQYGRQPALWLLGEGLTPGSLTEWPDRSGNGRDAYQPDSAAEPVADDDGVTLGDGRFFFIDDGAVDFSQFSAFIAFDLTDRGDSDQTLLRLTGLAVAVGGDANPGQTGQMVFAQAGRSVCGPLVPTSTPSQATLIGGASHSFLQFNGAAHASFQTNTNTLAGAYPTLGATREFTSPSAGQLFDGSIRELILYNEELAPGQRARNEDYQRSRWGTLLVWDYRDQTSPLAIQGSPTRQNAINGGWGSDSLRGGDLDDVIRGGPGDDSMQGGGGLDRFVISMDDGNDTITDYSASDRDVIDLSDIFGSQSGDPADFISFRTAVIRDENNIPQVITMIDLNYDGQDDSVDQTITLDGLAWSASQLPQLVIGDQLRLGGPGYQTTITLATDQTSIPALPQPHEIRVSRDQYLDAALDVPLSFTGRLEIDTHFTVTGGRGSDRVRTVSFAAGETTRTLILTPIATANDDSGDIVLTVLSKAAFADGPADSLTLTLTDAPKVFIATTQHASFTGPITGQIEIRRSGPLDAPLTLQLSYAGSAILGETYTSDFGESITIAANEALVRVHLVPVSKPGGIGDDLPAALLSISTDPTLTAVLGSGAATVLFFDQISEATESYAAWNARYFPGETNPDSSKDDDHDGIERIFEYIHGTNPLVATPLSEVAARIQVMDGHVEVQLQTIAGLTDVDLLLHSSSQLDEWADVTGEMSETLTRQTAPFFLRTYRSAETVEELGDHRFFRFDAEENLISQ